MLLPVEPQRAEGGSIERGRHLRRVGVAINEPQIRVAGGFVAAALIEGGRIQIGRLGRDRGVRRPRGDRQRFGRLFGFAQAVVDAAQRQVAIRFPHAAAHAIAQNAPRLLVLAGVEQLRPQRQAGAPVQLPLRRGPHHLAVEVGGAPVLAARTVDAADAVHPLQRLRLRSEPSQARKQCQRAVVLIDGDRGVGGAQQRRQRRGACGYRHAGKAAGLYRQRKPFPGVERRLRLSQRLPRPRQHLQRLGHLRVVGIAVGEALQRRRPCSQFAVLDQQIRPVQDGARRQFRVRAVAGLLQPFQTGRPPAAVQKCERQIIRGALRVARPKAGVQRLLQRFDGAVRFAELQRRFALDLQQPAGEAGVRVRQRPVGVCGRLRELLVGQVQKRQAAPRRRRQFAVRKELQVPREALGGRAVLPGQQRGVRLRKQRLRSACAAGVVEHDTPEGRRRIRVAPGLKGYLARPEQRVGPFRLRQLADHGQVGSFGFGRAVRRLQRPGVQQQGAPAVLDRRVSAAELPFGERRRLGRPSLRHQIGRPPVIEDRHVLGLRIAVGERPQQRQRLRVLLQVVSSQGEQKGGVGAQFGVRMALDQRRERLRGVGEQTVGEGVGAPLVEIVGFLGGRRRGKDQEQRKRQRGCRRYPPREEPGQVSW